MTRKLKRRFSEEAPVQAEGLDVLSDPHSTTAEAEQGSVTDVAEAATTETIAAEEVPSATADVESLAADDELEAAADESAAEPGAEEPATDEAAPAAADAGAGGGMTATLGFVLLFAGAGVLAVDALGLVPELSAWFTKIRLGGAHLVLAGLLLVMLGGTRRRQAQGQREAVAQREKFHQQLRNELQTLSAIFGNPEHGEAIGKLMLVLQRQDEKIANLTKALKMYGKPLLEISQQATGIDRQLGEVAGSVTQGLEKLEAKLASEHQLSEHRNTSQQKIAQELANQSRTQGDAMNQLQRDLHERHEETKRQAKSTLDRIVQLEKAMADAATPKSDTEVLTHLGELKRHIAATAERIEKVEHLAAEAGKPKSDEPVLQGLAAMHKQLTQQLQSLNAALQSAAMRAPSQSAAAGPAPAPAPRTADITPQSAPMPAPAAATHAAADPAALGPGGLAQSIAGEHRGDSKNVLGAIAKLKQMRK